MSGMDARSKLVDLAATLRRQAEDLDALAVAVDPVTVGATVRPWVVALPFYWVKDRERREITRRVFVHYRRIADALGVRITGVGSEGKDSRKLWCQYFDEVDYREFPQAWDRAGASGNAGLRDKFDETVRATRHLQPDRVFIGGSDDVIPLDWFAKAFDSNADLVGVTGGASVVGFRNLIPSRTAEWDGLYAGDSGVAFCGGGLMLSRRLLEAWRWAPFSGPGDEVHIERTARKEGWVCEGFEGRFVAFKGAQVCNRFDVALRHGATPGTAGDLRRARDLWEGLER